MSFAIVTCLSQVIYTTSGFSKSLASFERTDLLFKNLEISQKQTFKQNDPPLKGIIATKRSRGDLEQETKFAYQYDFTQGNIYWIKGKSGTGKTTFLEVLTGVLPTHQGVSLKDFAVYIPVDPVLPECFYPKERSNSLNKFDFIQDVFQSNKPILIFDEPMTGLEPWQKEKFLDFVQNFKNKLIVIASHQDLPKSINYISLFINDLML
jgi:energy-coupling factor transporter ATP-binding protein EcfA2